MRDDLLKGKFMFGYKNQSRQQATHKPVKRDDYWVYNESNACFNCAMVMGCKLALMVCGASALPACE